MPFSEQTKNEAFYRSGGLCECRRHYHWNHIDGLRCSAQLTRQTAQFHHITAQAVGGHDGVSNCEVLCEACHQQTASFGRHA